MGVKSGPQLLPLIMIFSTSGTPCDIEGTWTSYVMGICIDISLEKNGMKVANDSEEINLHLVVQGMECTPPKKHLVLDPKWNYTGDAIKRIGGPFYIYTQKIPENYIATFLGR